MTEQEAAAILGRWYRAAGYKLMVVAIELFGITYAADLDGLDFVTVTRIATGKDYATTLRRGITLSRSVKVERDRMPHWARPRPWAE